MANLQIKKSLVCYKITLNENELAWKNVVHNSMETINLNEATYNEFIFCDDNIFKPKVIQCYNKKCSVHIYYTEDIVLKKCHACSSLNCMECSVS